MELRPALFEPSDTDRTARKVSAGGRAGGMAFETRPAAEADCEFLWSVTATTMREYIAALVGWDEPLQEMRFWCRFDPVRWQIIVVAGRDVGGFAVDQHPQALFLSDLQLLPEYQGHGIGSAVIRQMIGQAGRAGAPLLLQVLDSNPRARRLYERLGFSFVGPSPMPHYSVMSTP